MEERAPKWYIKWFNSLQETPPEEVWDNIADQLDIDDVWDNIANALPTELAPINQPKSNWQILGDNLGRLAIAASILLLLTTPLPPVFNNENNSKNLTDVDSVNKESGKLLITKDSILISQTEINLDDSISDNENPTANIKVEKQPVETKQLEEVINITSHINNEGNNFNTKKNEKPLITAISNNLVENTSSNSRSIGEYHLDLEANGIIINDTFPAISKELIPLLSSLSLDDDDEETKLNKKKKLNWEAGLISNINNTWIVNPETSQGLKSSSLTHTKATFNPEVGIMFRAGNTSQLQAELYLFSQTGQKYQDYYNALFQTKTLVLEYQKLQLLYRRQLVKRATFLSVHILGGAYISHLSTVKQAIGNSLEDITNQYTNLDYGLTTGLDTEIPLSNKLFLSPGLRFTYSPHNIYKGTDQIPANFNKSTNLSVGFSVGVFYKFNK
ncbi:MAG: hypothetical protein CMO01_12755 [Thalassobius sp.]|nr:hypothetical protein [Thalassovita sp.]